MGSCLTLTPLTDYFVGNGCDGVFGSSIVDVIDVRLIFTCVYSNTEFDESNCEGSNPYTLAGQVMSLDQAQAVFSSLRDVMPTM